MLVVAEWWRNLQISISTWHASFGTLTAADSCTTVPVTLASSSLRKAARSFSRLKWSLVACEQLKQPWLLDSKKETKRDEKRPKWVKEFGLELRFACPLFYFGIISPQSFQSFFQIRAWGNVEIAEASPSCSCWSRSSALESSLTCLRSAWPLDHFTMEIVSKSVWILRQKVV